MIEKICARLEEEKQRLEYQKNFFGERKNEEVVEEYGLKIFQMERVLKIVQEIAKDGGWIPVETELPRNWEILYATCVSLVDDREPWVIEGIYVSEMGGFERMTPMLEWENAKVIAWMPKKLPAPYQKGE